MVSWVQNSKTKIAIKILVLHSGTNSFTCKEDKSAFLKCTTCITPPVFIQVIDFYSSLYYCDLSLKLTDCNVLPLVSVKDSFWSRVYLYVMIYTHKQSVAQTMRYLLISHFVTLLVNVGYEKLNCQKYDTCYICTQPACIPMLGKNSHFQQNQAML